MGWLVTSAVDYAVVLHSEDGDSVMVPPKARDLKIADKFGWNPPNKIVRLKKMGDDVVDPTIIVPGNPIPEPDRKPAKSEPTAFDTEVVEPPKTVDNPASALRKSNLK